MEPFCTVIELLSQEKTKNEISAYKNRSQKGPASLHNCVIAGLFTFIPSKIVHNSYHEDRR
jgi:uncharacterized membrane protein